VPAAPAIAVPPVPPDYGPNWWERYSETFASQDASAQLKFTADRDGRVRVDSVVQGSDPALAKVCTALLEEGPPWTPAQDMNGNAVPYHGTYHCVLDVKGRRPGMRLSTTRLGASGPIQPEQVGAMLADSLELLGLCFKADAAADAVAFGKYWLAFEIRPQGDVARVEWIERAYRNGARDACFYDALHRLRFPPASERTIADVEFEIGPSVD